MKLKMAVFILLLSSCTAARYGNLTYNIKYQKSNKKKDQPSFFSKQKIWEDAPIPQTKQLQEVKHELDNRAIKIEPYVTSRYYTLEESRNALKNDKVYLPNDSSDISLRVSQYQKANKLAWWSFGLGLGSVFLPFTFVLSYILALMAIRIYRNVKNPGIEENYNLAVGVLVVESLILLAGLILILYVTGFLIF